MAKYNVLNIISSRTGQMGRLDIGVETLPCTRYNSVCQANVILLRRLEPGRYVDFRLSVRNTRGRSSRIACSVTGTNATTPRDTIFPHQPGIILVPEVSTLLITRSYYHYHISRKMSCWT